MAGAKEKQPYVAVPKFRGLRRLMKERHLNAAQIAGLTQGEVSSVTVRNLLEGRHHPSTLTLTYIGRGLRVPVHELL